MRKSGGSSILILAQSLWIQLWYWVALRLLGGMCMAGIFIAIESWFLLQGTSKTRGTILSIYLGAFYTALTLGQLLIAPFNPMGQACFYIAAALSAASIAPLLFKKLSEPRLSTSIRLSSVQLFRLSPLGFTGGVVSGMVLAAIYGLVPVFAFAIGYSASDIGNLMAAIIFGGVSLQWPLGYLADRGDRRAVLNKVSFFSALTACALTLSANIPFSLFLALAWLFGGFSFTLYPLSMAYTCEQVEENQVVAATGGFVLSYSIGAIAGPLIAPLFMQLCGNAGLFYFLAAISLFLGLCGLKKPLAAQSPEDE